MAREYADHSCNNPVDPFDLARWLEIEAWNMFGTQIGLGLVYICALWAVIQKESGVCFVGVALTALGLFAMFHVVWIIIGMVEVARASACHDHAPELWLWSYAAVLVGAVYLMGIGAGAGGAGGKAAV